MKKLTYATLTALAIATTSCELETSDNGDLDGMWHMVAVDTLATGGNTDLSDERIYWSFQRHLMNVSDKDSDITGYFLRFSHSGDSLTVSDPYKNNRSEGDIKVEDAAELAPYGIGGLTDGYLVEQLSGSRMTLRSKALRLKFKKF